MRCRSVTAKMKDLEPNAWLTDVLSRLPFWPEELLHELLSLPACRFATPDRSLGAVS
ncbi:transposase domain-containing protein [Enterobacter chuandaensis]